MRRRSWRDWTIVAVAAAALVVIGGGVAAAAAGLVPLADSCDDAPLAGLAHHDGFQVVDAPECSPTQFGAVTTAEDNPSLLITEAPDKIKARDPLTLKVSTRNLVRDRFLPAGQGGYYIESATVTADGLTRGHFHVACRVLGSTAVAPDPAPVPAFFKAVEDGKGGKAPDVVTVEVPGATFSKGQLVQCAAWAGDGSHRTPMTERANQTPAFDAVRVEVK